MSTQQGKEDSPTNGAGTIVSNLEKKYTIWIPSGLELNEKNNLGNSRIDKRILCNLWAGSVWNT